jgi:hypothetical protein
MLRKNRVIYNSLRELFLKVYILRTQFSYKKGGDRFRRGSRGQELHAEVHGARKTHGK